MKIAIITRPDNKSPKILADSLQRSLSEYGVLSDVFYADAFLRRLVPIFEKTKFKMKFHFKLRQKIKYYLSDSSLKKRLKQYDAIVVSECIPNAYWQGYYGIEQLRKKLNVPIGIYEVFFLDVSERFSTEISKELTHYDQYYDFELAVSTVSYRKSFLTNRKFEIGLNLQSQGLKPYRKKSLKALIDFEWENDVAIKKIQLEALESAGIEYDELQGVYTISEIREKYKECSLFFLQHFESFGLPIAECLSYGAVIATPHSGWPMAFRKDETPLEYGTGVLPSCFLQYSDKDDLIAKLLNVKRHWSNQSYLNNFDCFIQEYSHFHSGSDVEIKRFLNYVNCKKK